MHSGRDLRRLQSTWARSRAALLTTLLLLVSLGGLTVGVASEPASSLEVVASPEPHPLSADLGRLEGLKLNSAGQVAGMTDEGNGWEPVYPVFMDIRTGERIIGPPLERLPGGTATSAISESGDVFGVHDQRGFVWNPRTAEFAYLPLPLGYSGSNLWVVNDAGDKAFGKVSPDPSNSGEFAEWTRADGSWTVTIDAPWKLPAGGPSVAPMAVNDAGFIVGYLGYATGGPTAYGGWCSKAAVWSPVTGAWSDLGLGCGSFAWDINDLGQVSAESFVSAPAGGAYEVYKAWFVDINTGVHRDIGRFPGIVEMSPRSINNLGQVVGIAITKDGRIDGFFWDPTTGKLTKLKAGNSLVPSAKARQTWITGINDSGLIVGLAWRDTYAEDGVPLEYGTYFWDLNEAQPLPVLSIGDVEIVEGDSGICRYASFPVTLSSPAHSAVTAKLSVISGQGATGAAAGTDFTSLSGTIRFTPRSNGETATQQKINICIKSDSVAEGDQEFTVELADVFGGAVPGSIIGTGTIIDDDDNPSALPSFSVGDVTVEEGDLSLGKSRVLRVPVTLSRPAATRISVEVAIVSSSAEALVDFTLPRITMVVTFEPNQVSKFVSIAVLPDFFAEADESFLVRLSNASAVAAIDREQGAVTIQNDD